MCSGNPKKPSCRKFRPSSFSNLEIYWGGAWAVNVCLKMWNQIIKGFQKLEIVVAVLNSGASRAAAQTVISIFSFESDFRVLWNMPGMLALKFFAVSCPNYTRLWYIKVLAASMAEHVHRNLDFYQRQYRILELYWNSMNSQQKPSWNW